MLTVHRSNRAEALADALAGLLAAPPDAPGSPDPLAEEWVVVPSPGMERWLSIRIARRARICTNVTFPFPAALVHGALAAALGLDPEAARRRLEAWSGRRIAWRVLRAVKERAASDPRYEPLRSYLGDGAGPDAPVDARGWGILRRIADTYDGYLTYRQDLVLGWDQGVLAPGEGNDWQPDLWQAITRDTDPHPAAAARDFLAALDSGDLRLDGLPPRICLFGVSTLPPFFLQVIRGLARHRDVHLFTLDPCRYWWGDLQTPVERARRRRKHPDATDPDLHLDDTHPLLASMGLLGRDFQNVLYGDDAIAFDEAEDAPFADPLDLGPPSVLSILQSDLLDLVYRRPNGPPEARPLPIPAGDRSLAFHSCHGAMRQVEVLRDVLLRLFDEMPSLQPRDVVVMTPDIEAYAPLIEAVFSDGRRGRDDPGFPALPFHVADRGLRSENPVAETVARVLALPGTRMAASDVLDLLAMEPFRRRFALDEADLPRVRQWIEESGIRWGIDAAHRAEHDQPADAQNTWRFGLDRLLVGFAMPGEDRTFAGVLPHDEVEGGLAQVLGRFADGCEALFEQVRDLPRPRTLGEWKAAIDALLEALVRTSPRDSWRVRQVQEVARGLAEESQGDFDGTMTLDAYRALLEEAFGSPRTASGFLGGAITFCAMVPLRAIPFRVVCLLGLDDKAFPRQRERLAFDRMARDHRPGDRNPRDDDRYLFLEALLSARDRLAIFFTGRSVRDNVEIPPAVPVAELLDLVDSSFAPVGGKPARHALVRQHPLQPFSPDNFDPTAPFSYDRRYLAGARRLAGGRGEPPALFEGILPDPVPPAADGSPGELVVRLDDLVRFWQNPVAHLLRERLGIRLGEVQDLVKDREPVQLGNDEAWELGNAALRLRIEGADRFRVYEVARGKGRLPLGSAGRAVFDGIDEGSAPIAAYAVAARAGLEARKVVVRFRRGPIRLEGVVEDVWGNGLLDVLYSRLAGRHQVATWIRHLAASAMDPAVDGPARLVGRGKDGVDVVTFLPLDPDPRARRERAEALLGDLLDLYHRGSRAPLPLLPFASKAYADTLRSKGDGPDGRAAALKAANTAYHVIPPHKMFGDETDPYIRRLHGRQPALDAGLAVPGIPEGFVPGFQEVSMRFWQPLLAALPEKTRRKGAK